MEAQEAGSVSTVILNVHHRVSSFPYCSSIARLVGLVKGSIRAAGSAARKAAKAGTGKGHFDPLLGLHHLQIGRMLHGQLAPPRMAGFT